MIITIKGADFSGSNLGTLSTYLVSKSIGSGATYSIPSYVEKNASVTWTITLASGYTFGTYSVTMGGSTVTPTISEDGLTMTITITSVTGNVVISVATINSSTGEEDSGSGDSSGDNIQLTALTYDEKKTSSGISKSTGGYLSSSTGYVNVYNNIDITKTYYASGYAPNKDSDNACICYYKSDGTFISAQDGNDFDVSSADYTNKQLTVPSETYTIKIFSRTNDQEAVLAYYMTLTIVNYDEQKSGVNLNGTTGEYGTSSVGYVNVYNNIDSTLNYYADGFCPSSSSEPVPICYYDADGTFISSESGADWGISSKAFSKHVLTIPSDASTIKVFSRTDSDYAAALYNEV